MTLSKLKQSEQILLAAIITALVLGIYTFIRFIPENKALVSVQQQALTTENKLRTARIPDDPEQDIEQLLKQLDEQEQILALVNAMADNTTRRLAPFGSQQLKVLISELARNTGVRIRTNEAYQARNRIRTNQPKSKKAQARALEQAKLLAAQTDLILPSNHSWIERMSQKTMFHRPIQRLVLEGDYQQIRSFIHGLEALEWQVTVVQLNIERMPADPIRGFAQLLRSELVLAL